jgi:hypothetical protein
LDMSDAPRNVGLGTEVEYTLYLLKLKRSDNCFSRMLAVTGVYRGLRVV